MPSTLPGQISSQQLAALLSISQSAVFQRAKKGGWPRVFKRGKGRATHLYLVSGLPEDIRAALATRIRPKFVGAAAQAGYARAKELVEETQAAADARRKTKEAGLAAYERLPEPRKIEANARQEILRARDAFITAAGLQKKKGTALFIREYKAGAIQLPEWVEKTVATRKGAVSLSWASLYRWEKAFGESGLAGLANGYAGTRGTSIARHMQDFIKGLLCRQPHLGIPTVRQAVQARFAGQDIPNQGAIRRFVSKWRNENQSLILYTTSPDEWRNKHMIAQGRADEQVVRLNQIWEFDSTPGDVMLVDGRHSLIGVIDVYSRRTKLQVIHA